MRGGSATRGSGRGGARSGAALRGITTAGVRQKLPYGGQIEAAAVANAVAVISGNVADGQTARVALTASVPLLRGAGLVNLEGLINGERQLVYQIRDFEQFRRE